MSIKSIKIEDATAQQRADYVRNFLNIEISGAEGPTEIDAIIAKAQPGNTMMFYQEPDTPTETAAQETAGEVPLKPEEATGRQAGSLGKGDPRATIMIPAFESEDGSGSRDVLVGVNGRGWQLKRAVELDVPWRVVEALKNANALIIRHRSDEGHEGEVVATMANRFNVQLVRGPSEAEIAEWQERTGAQFCA